MAMSDWINVKDELPPYNKVVLVLRGRSEIVLAARKSTDASGERWIPQHQFYWMEVDLFSDVTHWMPLPARPA